MPKMELGERIRRLIDGLERAVEVWRKKYEADGDVIFSIYADVVEDCIPKLRDLDAYNEQGKKDGIRFLAKTIADKESEVGQGRSMSEMEGADTTTGAEFVQLRRLRAQVEGLLAPLPTGR